MKLNIRSSILIISLTICIHTLIQVILSWKKLKKIKNALVKNTTYYPGLIKQLLNNSNYSECHSGLKHSVCNQGTVIKVTIFHVLEFGNIHNVIVHLNGISSM